MPQSRQTHFKNVAAFAAKYKWDKVFKNGSSEICGRQSFEKFEVIPYYFKFFKDSSTNLTWTILEYFIPKTPNIRQVAFFYSIIRVNKD